MPTVEKKNSALVSIFKIGLLAGTLDGIAAIIWNYCYTGIISLNLFKGIASGMYGTAAFAGGADMIAYGVLFHYFIAIIFTTVLFLLYPNFNSILKNKYVIGVVYGVIVWVIMNLVVVPLSKMPPQPLHVTGVVTGLCISVVCIGLPIAIMSNNHYYRVKGGLLYL